MTNPNTSKKTSNLNKRRDSYVQLNLPEIAIVASSKNRVSTNRHLVELAGPGSTGTAFGWIADATIPP